MITSEALKEVQDIVRSITFILESYKTETSTVNKEHSLNEVLHKLRRVERVLDMYIPVQLPKDFDPWEVTNEDTQLMREILQG
jgi:hypothetical protein